MDWAEFASILLFICQVFFIVLMVLGAVIILAAIFIGAVKGFRQLYPAKPRIDRDPMI